MRTTTKFYELTADVPNPAYDGRVKSGPQAYRVIPAGTRYSSYEHDAFGSPMTTYRRITATGDHSVDRDVAEAIKFQLVEVEATVIEQMIDESVMPIDVWEAMRRNPAVAHAMMDTFRAIRDESN